MKKFFIPFLVVVAIGLSGLFVAKFLFGGGKSGTQNFAEAISGEKDGWKQQTFNEAGLSLTLSIPLDTTFRKEIADDAGRIRIASFYVEKGSSNNPTYQLYAVYQPLETVTEKELDKIKTGMDPNSVKEATISGIRGIEGLINISGSKNHFTTAIIKDGKLFTVSTYPPTVENKALTDQILTTFSFK
jgi:hypothetical protein